ncbi:hypothetical protein [Nocardia gamkensis]|uniref:hypothetical protein n=1 Tax=Nocardia gamkensis TaxID=352869 RepID=UPI0037C94086
MTNPDHAEAVERITDADTPGEYRRSRRVPYRRAAMSPHQRGLPTPLPIDIDRIASDVGFTTTRRFREAFQRQFGQTPAQLREDLFGICTNG